MDTWQELMRSWNDAIYRSKWYRPDLTEEQIQANWLGRSGATDLDIARLEARLQVRLPPSYVSFLRFTNGWSGILTDYIHQLWSTENVDWFSKRNQDWIDAWNEEADLSDEGVPDADYFVYSELQSALDVRLEYLQTALEVSARGDDCILLLNPKVVTSEGEWEAWFLSNWMPGARRFRTFWELMLYQYRKHLNT